MAASLPKARGVPTFVFDMAVSRAWLFGAYSTSYTRAALDRLTRTTAAVPAIWPVHLADAVAADGRDRPGSLVVARSFLADLHVFSIRIERWSVLNTWNRLLDMAVAHGIGVFDAAYLDTARRLMLPLATEDPGLTAAATAAGVPIFAP